MKKFENLSEFSRIYFIGIGGISLSALSIIMKNHNYIVAGSDLIKTELTEKLKSLEISVNYTQKKQNIINFKPDLVVYSGAVKEDNPELKFAKSKNILCLERADFLGLLTKNYKNVISVAGAHGKTTVTSMISEIFINAGLNPTVHIGGESVNLNGNVYCGENEFFITEACEYRRSFLKFKTDVAVVLNIEEDHPDCYKNYEEIFSAFNTFVDNANKFIISFKGLEFKTNKKPITFNFKNADYTIKNIQKHNLGYNFDVLKNNQLLKRFTLNIFGKHNIINALCSIVVADLYNIDINIIYNTLYNFKGIKRRFEKITSEKISGEIYADYAHHPTEIKKLIEETKSFNKPIICLFQPHTYSRTKKYFENFLTCFENCYQVLIYKTYNAREKYLKEGSAKFLYQKLKENGKNVFYFSNFKSVIKHLKKYSKSNCIVLVVGAGDIYNIKKNL